MDRRFGQYLLSCFSSLQVNQILCSSNSICLVGLGLNFPPYNLTIQHENIYETILQLNGEASSTDTPLQLLGEDGNTLTVQKTSKRIYEITDESLDLYLHITIMTNHLIVDLEISGNTCGMNAFLGLCGPCTSGHRKKRYSHMQNILPNGGIVVLDPSDSAQEILQKIEAGRLCQNLFYVDTEGHCAAASYAGSSLMLRNSAAVVETIQLFTEHYTTVELLVKTCGAPCGGTIFSYSNTKTFFVSSAFGVITLHFGDTNITTDITLEVDAWNQISVVWDRESFNLDLYVFNSTGYPQRWSGTLPGDIFPTGGSLAFGRWQPSADGSGFLPPDNFVGELDELRIWKRYLCIFILVVSPG